RLLILNAVLVTVFTPIFAKQTEQMFEKMQEIQQRQAAKRGVAAPPVVFAKGQMAQIMGIYTFAYAAGMVGFGSIYPAISLWLLSWPSVGAACRGSAKPERGPDPGHDEL